MNKRILLSVSACLALLSACATSQPTPSNSFPPSDASGNSSNGSSNGGGGNSSK